MAKTLRALITSSGYTPAAGMSFRNNVNGSATGAAFTDYNLTAWELSNLPSDPGDYAHGTQFVIGISFTQASRAQYIKRTGDAITIQRISFPTDGTDIQKDTSSVLAAGGAGSSVTVTLIGGRVYSGTFTTTAWFTGYSEPNTPGGSDPAQVTFNTTLNNPNGGGESRELNFTVGYSPDTGDFNPYMTSALIETNVLTRAELLSDHEIEWHANDTYTSLLSAASAWVTTTTPGATAEAWMRHRPNIGAPSWTNYGYISFYDPR